MLEISLIIRLYITQSSTHTPVVGLSLSITSHKKICIEFVTLSSVSTWMDDRNAPFYEHHYTWFILEQIHSRSVRIFLLSVISRYEKSDKSIVWCFQSNRRSSKVISVLIWIYIFRPKWQYPRILRTIIRFHIFKLLCQKHLLTCFKEIW